MVGSQHRMHDHVQRRFCVTLLVGPGLRRECAGKRYAVAVIQRLEHILDGIVEGDHVHEQALAVSGRGANPACHEVRVVLTRTHLRRLQLPIFFYGSLLIKNPFC